MIENPECWLTGTPDAEINLICFPFAGGSGHSYATWRPMLQPDIALRGVNLPGRGARFGEASITCWATLRSNLVNVLQRLASRPYALFGHSMGALIAYDIARSMQEHALPMPRCLFLSGHAPPHLGLGREIISRLDDEAFLHRIREFNGVPSTIMANKEQMSLILPVLRADMHLTENYDRAEHYDLNVPIVTFAGESDRFASDEEVGAWRSYTRAGTAGFNIPGDHFFIFSQSALVLTHIREYLKA